MIYKNVSANDDKRFKVYFPFYGLQSKFGTKIAFFKPTRHDALKKA